MAVRRDMIASSKRSRRRSRRRTPRQARALETVEIIFEATARVLQRGGLGALNTNRIAEAAGISIGTLYQYFFDKEAILLAMGQREIRRHTEAVLNALSQPSAAPPEPERAVIRALMTALGSRHKVRRILINSLVAQGHADELWKPIENVVSLVRARSGWFRPGRAEPIPAISLFVVTRAVIGTLRAATQEESSWLGTRELEDELVRLVRAYLADTPSGSNGLPAKSND